MWRFGSVGSVSLKEVLFCFFAFSEAKRIISCQRRGGIQEQLSRDVICVTFTAKQTPPLSFNLNSSQPRCSVLQRLAANQCHIRNLPAGEMHNWYEQMTWYRSAITCDETIRRHNRTSPHLVYAVVLVSQDESRSRLNLLARFKQIAKQMESLCVWMKSLSWEIIFLVSCWGQDGS